MARLATEHTMTDWVVLLNPLAGARSMPTARVEDALARNSVPATVDVVTSREAMSETIVGLVGRGRRVAVVGGDGTVNLAANALLEAGLGLESPLGILPSGTGCDLLRTFGISQTIERAAAHLADDGRSYIVDVGLLEGEWGRRHFVNVAQTGVGAAAAETAPRLPRWAGAARYPAAFAIRLPGFPACRVVVDGRRRYEGPALAVILANAQFFAGGWNVAPRAMLTDGELDVQIINARKYQAPGLVPKIVKGVHLGNPAVRRMSTPRVAVHTEVPWPVEGDGDLLGHGTFTASAIPAAFLVKI